MRGDLPLLDVPLAHAPAEDDAELESKEPALVYRDQPEFMRQRLNQAEFNVGLLRRYHG